MAKSTGEEGGGRRKERRRRERGEGEEGEKGGGGRRRSYSTEAPLRPQSDFRPFPYLILVYTETLPCGQADMISLSQVRNSAPPGCCLVGITRLGRGRRAGSIFWWALPPRYYPRKPVHNAFLAGTCSNSFPAFITKLRGQQFAKCN